MTTIEEIYTYTKNQLGSVYNVLSSYDATDQVDPSGSIAINISDFQHLDHTDCNDYQFTVTVSGFTTADEDKTRSIIYAMENYVLKSINLDALKDSITNCAGAVMGNLTTQSDGDSNEFTLTFDLYICDAVFNESTSSSSSI
jgi:hypothetical protein